MINEYVSVIIATSNDCYLTNFERTNPASTYKFLRRVMEEGSLLTPWVDAFANEIDPYFHGVSEDDN